jgi:hypothetical protein
MLWYKSWLETQYRLYFTLALVVFWMVVFYSMRASAPRPGVKPAESFAFIAMTQVVVISTWLAGAGIATQPAFQEMKGLFGATQYTLSLPVSRVRLLTVRSGIGWLEMTATLALFCGGMWLVVPVIRGSATAAEVSQYTAVLVVCSSPLYFLYVFLATFLDEMARMKGGMIAFGALWAISSFVPMPASVDIIRAMGDGSPLVAHTMPWGAMAFSLALTALLFFAASRIVQAREY